MEDSRDWAGLLPDLLVSIADRLPVPDYARFPAVCSSWAHSIRDLPPKPPSSSSSHFPWLALIPADPTASLTFLNRLENHRLYRTPAAAAAADLPLYYLGHRDGWLATILPDFSILLLNPLTSASSRLPSTNPLLGDSFPHFIDKVFLSASPGDGSPLAVIVYVDRLAFARQGDIKWTPLHNLHHYCDDVDTTVVFVVQDVIYHDGKFFAIFVNGYMLSFDLSGPSPVVSVLLTTGMRGWLDCDFEKMFLVSAPSGDLLVVRKRSCRATSLYFDVLRFDPELNRWVVVNDLGGGGDWSLFLDDFGSVVLSGMSGMDGNHIFFVDYSYTRNKNIFKVGVYDLGKGTAEALFPEDISFDMKTYEWLVWFRPSLS